MLRKIASMFLLLVMIANVVVPASATEVTVSEDHSFSVFELERFLSLTKEGTIHFDVAGAKAAGYPATNISAIHEHITMMNNLATNNNLYIDESFTLRLSMRALPEDDDNIPGINHVEIHWYGLTEVYIDSVNARNLVNNAKKVGNYINAVDVVLTINSFPAFGPYALQLSALVSTVSIANAIQVWQIENAASHGTGIIMSTYHDGTTAVPLITYTPQ